MRIFLPSILAFLLMLLLISLLSSSPLFVLLPLPPVSSAAPPLRSSAHTVSSYRPPAPLSPSPPFSAPSSVSVPSSQRSLSDPQGGGLSAFGSASVVSSAPPGFPPLSAPSSLLSVPPPAVSASHSLPPGVSVIPPPSSSFLSAAPSARSGLSAPALGSSLVVSATPQFPPGPQPSLFRPFTVSDPALLSSASVSAPLSSTPLGSAAGPSGFASTASGSAFGHTGFAPQPGPSSAFPPLSGDFAAPSAPPLSEFDYPPDDPFAPGFADPEASGAAAPDPEAPVPPPLSDSARTEVRRMYQYLVDLFPQAPPPPRALFEEFFAAPSSPHQPVFLSWFERVRSTLAEADSRILSLLASGRPESSLFPPRHAQYSVGGGASLGSAAPVNPSLMAMFERQLRPSLHLGLTVREAALLESSSRALSQSLSHAMWLLSGLLGFVRLQGFFPSDTPLFNMLVTSLSKCLAHQASISASHTAFVGLKRCQFYLSHLPAYFTDVHKRAMMAPPIVCADSLFLESDISSVLSNTQTSSSLRSQQALVEWPPPVLGLGVAVLVLLVRHRHRDSGSPSRSSKRVRFDSPAPSSTLKPPNKGFRR